jgi:hypothetical protein
MFDLDVVRGCDFALHGRDAASVCGQEYPNSLQGGFFCRQQADVAVPRLLPVQPLVNRDLPPAVVRIGVPAMILVLALGTLPQKELERRLNHEQLGLDGSPGTRSREVEDRLPPNALPELPSLNEQRPIAGPCKSTLESNDQINAIAVVQPNLFVPLVADVVGKGSIDRFPHQAIVRETIELRAQMIGDDTSCRSRWGQRARQSSWSRLESRSFENTNTPSRHEVTKECLFYATGW